MNKKGIDQYNKTQSVDVDKLVLEHASLVMKAVNHIYARLPSNIEKDDLIQAGYMGLLAAAQNYQGKNNAKFETYANTRVRGAILDEVRGSDWVPRTTQKRAKDIREAIAYLEKKLQRAPNGEEIAKHLEISLDEYYSWLSETKGHTMFSLNDDDETSEVSDNRMSPLSMLQSDEKIKVVAEAMKSLPEREALVLSLYYDDELNLKEIGQIIEVSESRVSQILSQSIIRLQSILKDY